MYYKFLIRYQELEAACGEMKMRDELYNSLVRDSRPELFDEDVLSLLKTWSEIQGKWFLPRFLDSRGFINKLRFFNKSINKKNVEGGYLKTFYATRRFVMCVLLRRLL